MYIYLRMRDSIDVDLLKRMFSQQKYVVCKVAQEAHVAGAGAGVPRLVGDCRFR